MLVAGNTPRKVPVCTLAVKPNPALAPLVTVRYWADGIPLAEVNVKLDGVTKSVLFCAKDVSAVHNNPSELTIKYVSEFRTFFKRISTASACFPRAFTLVQCKQVTIVTNLPSAYFRQICCIPSLCLCATLIFAQPSARSSPEWLKTGVIYEINPRTFSPSGDFAGIGARLPDLQRLGVNILWIMPVHPPGRKKSKGSLGSPYSVRDYYAIDPAYGAQADFKALIRTAHRLGFKVILDMVANHTAWDSVLMQSPDFYQHGKDGAIISPDPDWSDVAALNYRNPKLRAYMLRMLEFWIRDFDLDGFRCDVAFKVPTDFWNQVRLELEKIKPDIMMLAEAHSPDLVEKAFDLDYSWPLHSELTDVFEYGAAASGLQEAWAEERKIYPKNALHLRFSDNHDEKRAIARFGERGALAASAFMFTLDGVPLLYNGMEVGDTTESGAPALFERLPVFWPIGERRPEFFRFYRQMIQPPARQFRPGARRDLVGVEQRTLPRFELYPARCVQRVSGSDQLFQFARAHSCRDRRKRVLDRSHSGQPSLRSESGARHAPGG